ncbi:MAG: flagellar type III secretion system pore protein FliP [Burkholderiaceae bacterium]|nr:flagellar type III secretion system pore protein FliP [Burkholderiaceae bacterium]
MKLKHVLQLACGLALGVAPCVIGAATADFGGIHIQLDSKAPTELATPIKLLLLMSLLSLAPAILFTMTAFTRIIIVLSMIRHAIGMPETPHNQVLISLALFLTLFTMTPVIEQVKTQAYEPYTRNEISSDKALDLAVAQVRNYMIRQTREPDLMLMVELSHQEAPAKLEDVGMTQLIPAYMISELKTAFQIGFIIFLPFLLIDLVVSSVLMSLGMMMVPPVTISLPLKILMFVLIDGWNIVIRALVGSFH